MLVRPCVRNVPGKIDEASPSGYSLHPRENGPAVFQGPGGVTTSLTLLGPVLVRTQRNYLRLLLTVRYFAPLLSAKKNWAQKTMNDYAGLHWNFLFMKLSLFCLPKVNVAFKYLSIFGLNLHFCENQFKVSDIEGKMVLTPLRSIATPF